MLSGEHEYQPPLTTGSAAIGSRYEYILRVNSPLLSTRRSEAIRSDSELTQSVHSPLLSTRRSEAIRSDSELTQSVHSPLLSRRFKEQQTNDLWRSKDAMPGFEEIGSLTGREAAAAEAGTRMKVYRVKRIILSCTFGVLVCVRLLAWMKAGVSYLCCLFDFTIVLFNRRHRRLVYWVCLNQKKRF
jgi:Flp pilus assembly protein TadB